MDRFDPAFDRIDDLFEVHDVQFGLPAFPTSVASLVERRPVMREAPVPDLLARVGGMIPAAYGATLAFLAPYTGSGREAVIQVFIVRVMVAVAITGIGIITAPHL